MRCAHLRGRVTWNCQSQVWTFTDIFEENYFPSVPFHGGFGLLNLHGVAKPVYRATLPADYEAQVQALAEEDSALAEKFKSGEIDFDAFRAQSTE